MKPISKTPVSEAVTNASPALIVAMLQDVSDWPVNINDPSQLRRTQEALRLLRKLEQNDDFLEEARRFLHTLVENTDADKWLVMQPANEPARSEPITSKPTTSEPKATGFNLGGRNVKQE